MNSHTSSFSFLDNRYIFPFLGINLSFMSIAWFQIFLVGILSDCFLPKTFIYLWNFSETNFFASTSDFATSFSLFQISYSSATLFIFIIFLSGFITINVHLLVLLIPDLFSAFSSCFFPASSFASSSFCFYHPAFLCFGLHCLLHSSGHLVIFTFLVFQLISGLWWASYGIPKITLHFCSPITSISILSLYP